MPISRASVDGRDRERGDAGADGVREVAGQLKAFDDGGPVVLAVEGHGHW